MNKFESISTVIFISVIAVCFLVWIPANIRYSYSAIALGFVLFYFLLKILTGSEISKSIFLVFFCFLGYFLMNSICHPALTEYAENKRVYFLFTISFAFLSAWLSKSNIRVFRIIFFGFIIVGFFYSLINIFSPKDISNSRISEFGLNPLINARLIAFFLIGLLFFSWECFLKIKKKYFFLIFCFILIIIAFYSLAITGSRGPLLALLASALLINSIKNQYNKMLLMLVMLLIVAVFFPYVVELLPVNLSERLTSEAILFQIETTRRSDRIFLYQVAVDLIKNNFFWGVGLGNFSNYAVLNAPHNIYLECFAELGCVGFIFFLCFLINSFRNLRKIIYFNNKNYKIHYSVYVYLFYLISMLFDGEITIQSLVLFYLGFLLCMIDTKKYYGDL